MMAAEVLGGKLLREIESEKLSDLLHSFHKAHDSSSDHCSTPIRLGIPALDLLWGQHNSRHNSNGKLEITGPGGLPLIYHIVSTVVAAPRNRAIVVIDADGKFDVSRLTCSFEELQHVYVFRPATGIAGVPECLKEVERFLMEGDHRSWDRESAGTVVSSAHGGDIMVSWRGWLVAESGRRDVPRFGEGVSVEEALGLREERMRAVEGKSWRARCDWGEYQWEDG